MTDIVIQISDTHVFADPARRLGGCATRETLGAVLAAVSRERVRPGALLVTGDLAELGEAEAYAWLAARLGETGLRFAVLPGNHDDPAAMRATDWGARGQCGGSLELGAWCCELFDSHLPGFDRGALAPSELERLAAVAHAATERPLLVAIHHPPVPIASPWMDAMGLADASGFWAALDGARRVRGVVFGHVHQSVAQRRGAVRVLGAPSTCVQFAPHAIRFQRDERPPAYRRLELRADGRIVTRVVRVPV
ncbi:MAG: metallophosphoesterase [Gammaproteobacteria bacterium]|nr:metallophosphoesterase [Gammaproteobacteria bacterium]MBI5618859.1 metallophosphoesterase [Gammaproteobacteria bacterium]